MKLYIYYMQLTFVQHTVYVATSEAHHLVTFMQMMISLRTNNGITQQIGSVVRLALCRLSLASHGLCTGFPAVCTRTRITMLS